MSDMKLKIDTTKQSMDEVRPALDAAIRKHFPGGVLKAEWEGDVLHVAAMGATGTVVYEDGRLLGQATLKPPASLMRPMIEQKMAAALKEAAG